MKVYEYKLARSLSMSRAFLLETMPNQELIDWIAMEQIAPMYDPWLAHAEQCWLIENVNRSQKRTIPIDKWIRPFKPKKITSQKEIISIFRSMAKRDRKTI